MTIARALLLASIRFYRRHVSPRKGFACAYRVHGGGCSCSALGLRAVSRYGAWQGLGVLRLRLRECQVAAEALRARRRFVVSAGQAGFVDCDVPCDGCSVGDACDLAACLDCGDIGDCSWGRSKPTESRQARRRRRRGEPSVPEPGPGAPLQP